MVVTKEEELEEARNTIQAFITELGFEELDQSRLERMFAFYNSNWERYYGTEEYFVIE